ncbi:MAG: hypothetical protein KC933_42890, partial [Myxococcales bacterium]|nr:hypothetical protein [Myxococcales bacterium]
MSRIDQMDLRGGSFHIDRHNYQPERHLVIPQTSPHQALRSGDLVVARVTPELEAGQAAPADLLVLVDTSASRALGFQDQVNLLPRLFQQLPGVKELTVAAFDQEVVEIYRGAPDGFDPGALLRRHPLGATDMAGALSWAAAQKTHTRLLLITDGISTAGSSEWTRRLRGSSLKRLDVIA